MDQTWHRLSLRATFSIAHEARLHQWDIPPDGTMFNCPRCFYSRYKVENATLCKSRAPKFPQASRVFSVSALTLNQVVYWINIFIRAAQLQGILHELSKTQNFGNVCETEVHWAVHKSTFAHTHSSRFRTMLMLP